MFSETGKSLLGPFGRKSRHLKVEIEGRALGSLESSLPPSVQESSCCQVGPGRCIILNFATSLSTELNNAFSCTGHGHLPWPFSEEEGYYVDKKTLRREERSGIA